MLFYFHKIHVISHVNRIMDFSWIFLFKKKQVAHVRLRRQRRHATSNMNDISAYTNTKICLFDCSIFLGHFKTDLYPLAQSFKKSKARFLSKYTFGNPYYWTFDNKILFYHKYTIDELVTYNFPLFNYSYPTYEKNLKYNPF